jgi:hypothetical protein
MTDLISSPWSERPDSGEYEVFYAGYVSSVPDGDLLPFMVDQLHRLQAMMRSLDEAEDDYTYADGKWTVREVLGHIVDTEWVFSSRLLRIARGDTAALPGMDQDDFMAHSNVGDRSISSLVAEFSGLRTAAMTLMDSLRPGVLDNRGNASGYDITVRAQGWILAGHCEHHLLILRDRYGLHWPN